MGFTTLKISRLPAYHQLLQLGRDRPGAILLDFACCFGNDLRKAVLDGWAPENAMGTDLRPEFWSFGHELFKSTPATFPVAFIAGDVFDHANIKPGPPAYEAPSSPRPNISTVKSLSPLQGHISAIHASSFFHLFDEDHQLLAARALASLLSHEPGSMLLGEHGGLPQKGIRPLSDVFPDVTQMFCHSPESWKELWETVVFKPGTVTAEAELLQVTRDGLRAVTLDGPKEGEGYWFRLRWSVTRV